MKNKSRREQSKQMPNPSEGNKTAARQYGQAQQRFVRSGRVDEQARAAEKALDSAERTELENAELVGERHIAEGDPAVKRR
jgi:hypothetical protein